MSPVPPTTPLTRSYLALRRAVGLIGILLPFTLMLGVSLFFPEDLGSPSISHYYHTGMGDVFVGALCAVALFLYYYIGYDRLDNWAGNAAATFAIGVAWFPTADIGAATSWKSTVHFTCAALFFLILSYFSICRFTKSGGNPTPKKKVRNKIYVACGIIIIGCLVAVALYKGLLAASNPIPDFVFWSETLALVAFGVSWLIKGETLFADAS